MSGVAVSVFLVGLGAAALVIHDALDALDALDVVDALGVIATMPSSYL